MAKNNKLINSLNEIARRNRSQNVATATWHENFNGTTDWICANEESDCYGAVTSWDDCCIDYEPKYGE